MPAPLAGMDDVRAGMIEWVNEGKITRRILRANYNIPICDNRNNLRHCLAC